MVYRYWCVFDGVEEAFGGVEALDHFAELGGSGAFCALGADEDLASFADDVGGGCYAFYGVIESEIQRIAGAGGDYGVYGLVELFEHDAADEFDSGGVGLLRVAGEDSGDFSLAGEGYVEHEGVAGHAGDFLQLFVEGVVVDGAFDRTRVAHEAGAVDDLDGFLGGEAGGDQFTAAGIAEHQVGLDEAEGDAEVGRDEGFGDVDGDAGFGFAEVTVV